MRSFGPRCSIPGLLLAVLALLSLVALRPAMPDQVAPPVPALQASPFADIPICHADAPGDPDGTEPSGHAHHGMACALCPACHALAAAAVVPDPGTPLPAPPAVPTAPCRPHVRRQPRPCLPPPTRPDHPAWPDRTSPAAVPCARPPQSLLPGPCSTKRSSLAAAAAASLPTLLGGAAAHAHAIAGARVFPVTLIIDDPGVADEASIPTFSYQRLPNDPETGHGYQYNLSGEFFKRITEHVAVGINDGYTVRTQQFGKTLTGF